MTFRKLLEVKDVWKTGGQQVMTYKDMSVLYKVKDKKITFKIKIKGRNDGKDIETEIGLDKDPEKDIAAFLKKEGI